MRAAYDWNHPEAVAVITDHLLEGAHDDLGMPMALHQRIPVSRN